MGRAMELLLDLPELQTTPAAEVKVKGWPSLMRKVRARGAVVITNHSHPEAVVVDAGEYRRLVARASAADASASRARSLGELQARFDRHLSVLAEGGVLPGIAAKPGRKAARVVLGPSR